MISVGHKFSHQFSFTQEDVEAFAKVTGDTNPIHLDESFAKKSRFGKRIMHGFLGASVLSKVFGTIFPGNGTIYLKQDLVFLKPMFSNENYLAEFEVTHVNPAKGLLSVSTSILDSNKAKTIDGSALLYNLGIFKE